MLKTFRNSISNKSNNNIIYFRRNHTVKPKSSEWKSTIGLEIHAQLATSSKLFSSGSTKYELPTNSGVNLFDAAIPGTLPVLNKRAVELAVLTSIALKCQVNPVSLFDRKHYFYSDLPNGYQITQQRMPLARNGVIECAVFNPSYHNKPYYKTSRVKQIQLEQDSGKSLHDIESHETLIDLNRAGIPLVEIVFEPDLEDAEEAAAVVKELCFILKKIGASTCKMEEGVLRVDANVSIRKDGEELGVRTEIKNIGSIRGVAQAINYEVQRQIKIKKSGGKILNQTLAWNTLENKTVALRDKEEYHDYRFMPEPNLPPLRIVVDEDSEKFHKAVKSKDCILDLRYLNSQVPQLPQEQRILLLDKYKTSDLISYNIVNIPKLYEYFIEIMTEDPTREVKSVYKVLLNTLLTVLNDLNMNVDECNISPSVLGELVDLRTGTLTEAAAKIVLEEIVKGSNLSVKELVKEKDLITLTEEQIRSICWELIEKEPDLIKNKKKRKNKRDVIVKRIMKLSNAKAAFVTVEKIVDEIIDEKENSWSDILYENK